jgi:hypothetical protein
MMYSALPLLYREVKSLSKKIVALSAKTKKNFMN